MALTGNFIIPGAVFVVVVFAVYLGLASEKVKQPHVAGIDYMFR